MTSDSGRAILACSFRETSLGDLLRLLPQKLWCASIGSARNETVGLHRDGATAVITWSILSQMPRYFFYNIVKPNRRWRAIGHVVALPNGPKW